MSRKPFAAIDIGSDRFCCLIAAPSREPGYLDFLGMGRATGRGVFQGVIVDMEEVLIALDETVRAAEKMSGVSLDSAFVSIGGRHVLSHRVEASMMVRGEEITRRDVRVLYDKALASRKELRDHQIIHAVPSLYVIDGQIKVRDPLRMVSSQLAVALHVVSTDKAAAANLFRCLGQCHIQASRFVSSPYAAALAVLSKDERELGATCIDIGASRTSYALFREGNFLDSGTIAIGGLHITKDIARALGCPLSRAEKIKMLYANDKPHHAPASREEQVCQESAANIIEARLLEILEYLNARLKNDPLSGKNLVFTGGGALTGGLESIARRVFRIPVRIGMPKLPMNAPESMAHPSFAVPVGLLHAAQKHADDNVLESHSPIRFPRLAGGFSHWLRDRLQSIST